MEQSEVGTFDPSSLPELEGFENLLTRITLLSSIDGFKETFDEVHIEEDLSSIYAMISGDTIVRMCENDDRILKGITLSDTEIEVMKSIDSIIVCWDCEWDIYFDYLFDYNSSLEAWSAIA